MYQVLCNTGVVTKIGVFPPSYSVANLEAVKGLSQTMMRTLRMLRLSSQRYCVRASVPVKMMNSPLCFGFPGQPCLTERQ